MPRNMFYVCLCFCSCSAPLWGLYLLLLAEKWYLGAHMSWLVDGMKSCRGVHPSNPHPVRQTWKEEQALAPVMGFKEAVRPRAPCLWGRDWRWWLGWSRKGGGARGHV